MISDSDLISFCQEAIRIPSMSGHEENVAKMIQKKMLELGFDSAEIVEYGSVLGCIISIQLMSSTEINGPMIRSQLILKTERYTEGALPT